MSHWTVAGVQMDCRLADPAANLATVRAGLARAAGLGARLVVFPECALTGYCFTSRDEAWPHAQPLPGPATEALAADCARLGVFAVVGLLERGPAGELFNSCFLTGPGGLLATYRKVHLPHLGIDRFTTPGDRPFAVHELGAGGLRVGINICYDGSFPESARCLALLGADLIVLPTNWPPGAVAAARFLVPARALENHVYYLAVNRVGHERGFDFIGGSQLVGPGGDTLAQPGPSAAEEGPAVFLGQVDPVLARAKRRVLIPGQHEVDRVNDRRPEMYGALTRPSRPTPGAGA